jgi:hypothetical protein
VGLKVNTQATSAPQALPIAVQHDASGWKTCRLLASDADAGTPRDGFLLAAARPASKRGEVRAFQGLVELRQIAMQDLLQVHLSTRHLALERLQ